MIAIDQGGRKRQTRSIAAFVRCYRLFNGGMAPPLRIKDRYLGIWMSFLYFFGGLFGHFICSKSRLLLSVDGHIILFDEWRRGSYWHRIGLPTFRWTSPSSLFVRCHSILLGLALHRWRFRVFDAPNCYDPPPVPLAIKARFSRYSA